MSPRSEPPSFDRKVPAPNRAGLLYFDAGRNALRVSVAASVAETVSGTKNADWHQSEVAWVDVGLDTESIEPSRDIAGSSKDAGKAALSLSGAMRSTVVSAMDRAKTMAAAGNSPYIPPNVRVIPPSDPLNAASLGQPTTFLTSGFDGQPHIYWRQSGFSKKNPYSTTWRKIDASQFVPISGLSGSGGAFSAAIDFAASDARTAPAQVGDVIEILVIDATSGQSAGVSFVIGGNQ